jgi:hypothetical protein
MKNRIVFIILIFSVISSLNAGLYLDFGIGIDMSSEPKPDEVRPDNTFFLSGKIGHSVSENGMFLVNLCYDQIVEDWDDIFRSPKYFAPELAVFPVKFLQLAVSGGYYLADEVQIEYYDEGSPYIMTPLYKDVDPSGIAYKLTAALDFGKGSGASVGVQHFATLGEYAYNTTGIFFKFRFYGRPAPKAKPVVAAPTPKPENQISRGYQSAVERCSKNIRDQLVKDYRGSRIAISTRNTNDKIRTEYAAKELEEILVNGKLTVVDRTSLDDVRKEQSLQYSGEFDKDAIADIGKFTGADIVLTVEIDYIGDSRTLRIRAIDVQTASMIASQSSSWRD